MSKRLVQCQWIRCNREIRSLTDELMSDEKRSADSLMVRCRSDHLDEFVVPFADPKEEITEQWQDGLHDWYTCRDAGQCSIDVHHFRSRLCHRIFRVHQNLQCYLPEAKHQQHLFVSQTPFRYRLRQDKQPDVAAM